MKKLMVFILTVFFLAGMAGAASADYIYANSSEGAPTHYWEIGTTKRPPPTGVHPEYALGAPEEGLAGWAAGWGGTTGELILGFEYALKNVDGDDLSIWHFGKKNPEVYASTQSTDPTTWHSLGSLNPTLYPDPDGDMGGGSVEQTFDFGELDGVFYIKIVKGEGGYGSGHFIDAAGGNPVPIPGAVWLFGSGLVALLGIRRRSEGRMISER